MAGAIVSILTPSFNREGLVAQTLESVLAQTWPHWENIVVDDGSSDRTKAIEMMRIVEEPLREDWQGLPFFATHIGQPEMDGSERRLRRPSRFSSRDLSW